MVVRPHKNWVQRINNWLLPNADLIHVLVLDLPNNVEHCERAQFSDEEKAAIARLLRAARRVKHLAVTWNIWAHLERECGAVPVESLYLMWDGAMYVDRPDLRNLEHPSALKDLTVYAYHYLGRRGSSSFRQYTKNYCPQTRHCPNLAYVAYATDSATPVNVKDLRLKGSMFIHVPSRVLTAEEESKRIKQEKEWYPNFSTAAEKPALDDADADKLFQFEPQSNRAGTQCTPELLRAT
ncbi:hypothetical protein C8R46DRAFT_1219731 [Mycena filopes]|nr:hypothetical protein C8R46DRAFT_1219731 [Mycena filopes]